MTIDAGSVIAKYISLRDDIAVISERHAEELRPKQEAMQAIENWLMHQMNEQGIDQIKSKEHGTAFKKQSSSVQMQDAVAFKEFVFAPAIEGAVNALRSTGYAIRDIDIAAIKNAILEMPMWDMIDFRAGKKGIQEFITNEQQPVPGVAVNTIATISIRRAS